MIAVQEMGVNTVPISQVGRLRLRGTSDLPKTISLVSTEILAWLQKISS